MLYFLLLLLFPVDDDSLSTSLSASFPGSKGHSASLYADSVAAAVPVGGNS